jgi:general secretion pathway protein E
LCSQCRRPVSRGRQGADATAGLPERTTIYEPVGCPACKGSGYSGRTGIYEMLIIDDEMRRLIHDRAAEQQLREYALAHGMRSLREDGMRWVLQGVTSLEEIVRVTRE